MLGGDTRDQARQLQGASALFVCSVLLISFRSVVTTLVAALCLLFARLFGRVCVCVFVLP